MEAGVVEVVVAACVVEGSRAAGAGIVEEARVVVTRTEGSKRAGVERARDERRRTRKEIWSEAILN